jgi:SIT4-associating protein SAP185/190
MFEGIEDSSDDESLNSLEGGGEDEDEGIAGPIEVEGKEVGKQQPEGVEFGKSAPLQDDDK